MNTVNNNNKLVNYNTMQQPKSDNLQESNNQKTAGLFNFTMNNGFGNDEMNLSNTNKQS